MATDADRGQQVTYALERSNEDATGVDSFSIIESSGRIYRLLNIFRRALISGSKTLLVLKRAQTEIAKQRISSRC